MNEADNNILIADAGSTKTQWLIGDTGQSVYSQGVNPVHLDDDALMQAMTQAVSVLPKRNYTRVVWYGAGCGTPMQCQRIASVLQQLIPSATIFVGSDMLCAARAAAGQDAAIVCILGTGSNSALYDGCVIVDNIPPLGYILGDEGSGAALGKRFVNRLFKRGFGSPLSNAIIQEHNLTVAGVQHNVYQAAQPNQYLASLVPVIKEYLDEPEIEQMVCDEFDSFVRHNLLRYADVAKLPIHIVGGVAKAFASQLIKVLNDHGLTVGKIAACPLDIPGPVSRFLPA